MTLLPLAIWALICNVITWLKVSTYEWVKETFRLYQNYFSQNPAQGDKLWRHNGDCISSGALTPSQLRYLWVGSDLWEQDLCSGRIVSRRWALRGLHEKAVSRKTCILVCRKCFICLKTNFVSYPEVVESEETLRSTMSSTDFAGRGCPASNLKLPEAAEEAPPSHEGRRSTGDSRHRELDLGESKSPRSEFRPSKLSSLHCL